MSEQKDLRSMASLKSKGSSSKLIYKAIIKELNKQKFKPQNILDIGCGQGVLLNKLGDLYPKAKLHGMDLTVFNNHSFSHIEFIKHDLNKDFPQNHKQFDLIISSEVIEHLENARHFLREIDKYLMNGGFLLLTTPNPESFTSLISFIFRGYHSAFGPKDYPAHINSFTKFELTNIINEISSFKECQLSYIKNGRIPHSNLLYRNVLPFLQGKRFSDNYIVSIKKS